MKRARTVEGAIGEIRGVTEFGMPPGPIADLVLTSARERNGSRMAALLRTLAGSGRNVQGTAAPVHSL